MRRKFIGMYYEDKIETLRSLFGVADVVLADNSLSVAGRIYPILDDVIILLEPSQYPAGLRVRLGYNGTETVGSTEFAPDIQHTFGEEWQEFPELLAEHRAEFEGYFDIVDMDSLHDKRVCDLGCGNGRWADQLHGKAKELVLVDFSEAVFVARSNLAGANNALFFMADIKQLPFQNDFADLVYCIGVLHHLPTNALEEVRGLAKYAPQLLIYLYSALDSYPRHFRIIFAMVNLLRRAVCNIRNGFFRWAFTWVAMVLLYLPMIGIGMLLRPFGVSRRVPLYDFYHDKSLERIRQDVYDRFFTRIEQRFSRAQISTLKDTFSKVTISDRLPVWHFLCDR
jgi:SAM-dependent methyltransferase